MMMVTVMVATKETMSGAVYVHIWFISLNCRILRHDGMRVRLLVYIDLSFAFIGHTLEQVHDFVR